VAVGRNFDDDERSSFGGDDDDDEETPVAERALMRCLPCLGEGQIRLVDALRESIRPCPLCRGMGLRIILLRGEREVFVSDEMKVAEVGRCKGAFRAGKRAAFGRVACLECGGRFRPLPGLRVPNHVSQRGPAPTSER
jgi:hypothetical protein